jgi:UDP-glucose 4-epimerase
MRIKAKRKSKMKNDCSRILVTGGAGFIGSHLVDRLLEEGYEVTVIDDLSSGSLENLRQNEGKKGFRFVKGDIRDGNLLKRNLKDIDAVFHKAALINVTLSVREPLLTNDVNVQGTINLLKACLDANVKRVVYASSAAVYGDVRVSKISEDAPKNPLSPYGISKLAAEGYMRFFYKVHGLETVSLRFFNAYGPRQRFDPEFPYSGVITIFLSRLVKGESPVVNGDGQQTRDFVYVQDMVEADLLALRCKNAAGKVFNIGSGERTSVNKVAETLKSVLNKGAVKTLYADPQVGDIRHSCADIVKAERMLGYRPRFSFRAGITGLVNWYLQEGNR